LVGPRSGQSGQPRNEAEAYSLSSGHNWRAIYHDPGSLRSTTLPVHYVLPDRLISCLTREQANPWVRKITLSLR